MRTLILVATCTTGLVIASSASSYGQGQSFPKLQVASENRPKLFQRHAIVQSSAIDFGIAHGSDRRRGISLAETRFHCGWRRILPVAT